MTLTKIPPIKRITPKISPLIVRWLLIAAVVVVALPAAGVLLLRGLPVISHDTPLHLMRLFLLDFHVRQGEILPRWVPELFVGYGYPLFNFYPPLMYYLAELLHLSGMGQAAAYLVCYVLAIVTGAVGAALLAASIYANEDDQAGFWPGLLAAAAYSYAPYLFVNVYVRGAFGETGAMALLPWVFWSFRRIVFTRHRIGAISLAGLMLALLAATHTITLLLAGPFLFAYTLFLAFQCRTDKNAFWLALLGFGAAYVLSALLSAGSWLPLVLERHYLSDAAYMPEVLLENLWTWPNWVESALRTNVIISGKPPYQLGWIQVTLILLGIVCARWRSGEWWFWLAAMTIGILAITPVAAGFYMLSRELAVIQFPWRMLSLVALAGAMISGSAATIRLPKLVKAPVLIAIILAIITITTPLPSDIPNIFVPSDIKLSFSSIARYESRGDAYGAGWHSEFLPRWAQPQTLVAAAPPASSISSSLPMQMAATRISDKRWEIRYNSDVAFPLSLSHLYFPGWHATLDGSTPLEPIPSQQNGTVEINIPAGEHTVAIWRAPTQLETFASILSLSAIIVLVISLFLIARRSFVIVLGAMLLIGSLWMAGTRTTIALPQQMLAQLPLDAVPGLRLLDVAVIQQSPGQILLKPTWFVDAQQPDFYIHWRLLDPQGNVVSELLGRPRFGIWTATAWAAGTLVNDAYELYMPSSLPAGAYRLEMIFLDGVSGEMLGNPTEILTLQLPATPVISPARKMDTTFLMPDGAKIARLTGVSVGGAERAETGDYLLMAPGDSLRVDAYWQLMEPDIYSYQSLIELRDWQGRKVASPNLNASGFSSELELWRPYLLPAERVTLHIPNEAIGGLYSLHVGVRNRLESTLLGIYDNNDEMIGDSVAPITFKVLAKPNITPEQSVDARYDKIISLYGYSMENGAAPETVEVKSSNSMTLTLFYKALDVTKTDYTRFVHLYSPTLGMAAQTDSMPLQGGNPTSTWVKGEEIADTLALQISPEAAPGCYRLLVGFYDAEAGGVRLPAFNAEGIEETDQAVSLQEVCLSGQ